MNYDKQAVYTGFYVLLMDSRYVRFDFANYFLVFDGNKSSGDLFEKFMGGAYMIGSSFYTRSHWYLESMKLPDKTGMFSPRLHIFHNQ